VLFRARSDIGATLELADPPALQSRVAQGLPLISFAQLPVDETTFPELASAVAELLKNYDADLEPQSLPESPDEWYALARRRFEENQASSAAQPAADEPSLAQMAVDLALRPYLEWAGERVLQHVEDRIWGRGYCPVCGGVPDFATLDAKTGSRRLVCSRCSSQWSYSRLKCPFCDVADHSRIVYYPGDYSVYRLYVCRACMHYLKTIDLREVGSDVLLPVERVLTVAMDAAARAEGYT
jgi:FdhE protein